MQGPPNPAAVVVDAGTEPWRRVEPLLARYLDELPAGGAVELLSSEEGVAAALPDWCRRRGSVAWEPLATGAGFLIRTRAEHPAPSPLPERMEAP
jgi:hypothetical protein